MKKKIVGIFVCILLITATVLPVAGTYITHMSKHEGTNRPYSNLLVNDALIPPDISNIKNSQCFVPDPGFYETSEYMIGSVAVGVIFLESNGSIDPSTEDWTSTEENNVKSEIQQALNWWAAQNLNAGVSFVYDWQYGVPTSYEPIIHPSGGTNNAWEQLWVSEAMKYLGYTSGDWFARTRSYINALRTSKGTDWAYAVYVVDSSNDAATDPYTPGCFSDNWCAYAYYGAFVVMTYDNNGWGISSMDQVMAHETGHIFWATDEYNAITEYSGYLNAADVEGSNCLMCNNNLCLSSGTQQQVGWRDTDLDSIHDIVDTNPDTTLNPYSPDPTTNTILTYNGSATVMPYPNNNPQSSNSGNSVTINTISNVQYRVDGGTWTNAQATNGSFNGPVENFTFTTSSLAPGQHTIEARAINSVGNIDPTPSSDTVTITTSSPPNTPSQPSGPTTGTTGVQYTYTTSTTDPDNDNVKYGWDWDGDGTVDEWDDNGGSYYPSGTPISTSHSWEATGTFNVKVKAEDVYGGQSAFSPALTVVITNTAPNKPATPSGETQGQTGTSYPYSTSATDPNGDKLEYGWDWDGDNVVDQWDDNGGSYYPSGTPISTSHAWSADGTYYTKVKAKDIYGAESVWSDPLTVTMPKNNLFINTWFLWFLERFPMTFPILRNLLEL